MDGRVKGIEARRLPGASEPLQCSRPPPRWFALNASMPGRAVLPVAAASFVALVAGYAWLSARPWVSDAIVPAPATILAAAVEVVTGADFWTDVGYSTGRVTAGFVAAASLALPLGLLAGSFRVVSTFLEPITEFLRYIPVPALVPLAMVLAGIGEEAKILLVFVGTFFQLLLMTADEVRRLDRRLIQASQSLGANRIEIVSRVLWPAARPGISNALRLCNGWAWSYVVVAELVAATEGLGFRVLRFYRFIQTPQIFVYLIALGLIGLLFDWAFRAMHRRAFRWAPGR